METRDRILEKGEELFFSRGVRSVTMEEIASAIGMSKKTLYQHFADKDSLVNSVYSFVMLREFHSCVESQKNAKNPVDETILSTKRFREIFSNINPAFMHDLQKYYPKVWQQHLNNKQQFREMVLTNLRDGIEQGYYRNDLDIEVLASLRIESIDLGFNLTVFDPSKFNLLNVQLAFIDHFVRGIVTIKGLKAYEEIKL